MFQGSASMQLPLEGRSTVQWLKDKTNTYSNHVNRRPAWSHGVTISRDSTRKLHIVRERDSNDLVKYTKTNVFDPMFSILGLAISELHLPVGQSCLESNGQPCAAPFLPGRSATLCAVPHSWRVLQLWSKYGNVSRFFDLWQLWLNVSTDEAERSVCIIYDPVNVGISRFVTGMSTPRYLALVTVSRTCPWRVHSDLSAFLELLPVPPDISRGCIPSTIVSPMPQFCQDRVGVLSCLLPSQQWDRGLYRQRIARLRWDPIGQFIYIYKEKNRPKYWTFGDIRCNRYGLRFFPINY